MSKYQNSSIVLTMLVYLLNVGSAAAGEPRGYRNVPVGMNLAEVIYGNIDGSTSFDGTLISPDIEVDIDGAIFRYAHYFNWNGRLSAVGLVIPYGEQDLTALTSRGNRSLGSDKGMGDPSIIIGSNIFGQPALEIEEFVNWKPTTSMNWSLWITPPMGKYDPDESVNMGSNRWIIKPELNYTKVINRFWLELNTSASLFTDNDDYQDEGKLEQKPLFGLEGHLSYDLPGSITGKLPVWASIDLIGAIGGETRANGENQGDSRNDWLLGGTLNFKLHKNHSLRFFYFDTVRKKNEGLDTRMLGLKWSYTFGGGLGY